MMDPSADADARAGSEEFQARSGWYPAMIGALLGALLGVFVAIVVMEQRLRVALALRPPLMVADYSVFIDALGRGADPRAVKLLAARYAARAEELAGQGVLVLRSDMVIANPSVAGVPQDEGAMEVLRSVREGSRQPGEGQIGSGQIGSGQTGSGQTGSGQTGSAAGGGGAGAPPPGAGEISARQALDLMSALRSRAAAP